MTPSEVLEIKAELSALRSETGELKAETAGIAAGLRVAFDELLSTFERGLQQGAEERERKRAQEDREHRERMDRAQRERDARTAASVAEAYEAALRIQRENPSPFGRSVVVSHGIGGYVLASGGRW